jgi:hypothetical protein
MSKPTLLGPVSTLPHSRTETYYEDFTKTAGIPNELALAPGWTLTRPGSATYWGPDGKLRVAGPDEPRFHYDPLTGEPLGLLVEEEATSTTPYSGDPKIGVFSGGVSQQFRTYDKPGAPDGTNTVIGFDWESGYAQSGVFPIEGGSRNTLSMYLKPRMNFRYFTLRSYNSSSNHARVVFDLELLLPVGVFTAGSQYSPVSSHIVAEGEWFRLYFTFERSLVNSTAFMFHPVYSPSNGTTSTPAAFDAWGFQNFVGEYRGSFLYTGPTSVTRPADILTRDLKAPTYNPNQGTLILRANNRTDDTIYLDGVTTNPLKVTPGEGTLVYAYDQDGGKVYAPNTEYGDDGPPAEPTLTPAKEGNTDLRLLAYYPRKFSEDEARLNAHGTFTTREWDPSFLFANGEVGVWFDPSDMSTMFQDSDGTMPVTEPGQPVGLILDKSKGGTRTRYVSVPPFTDLASAVTSKTARSFTVVSVGGVYIDLGSPGRYRVSLQLTGPTGTVQILDDSRIVGGSSTVLASIPTVSGVECGNNFDIYSQAGSIYLRSSSAGTVTVSRIEIHEVLPGEVALGPELVYNGDFSSGITGWFKTSNASITVTGGVLTLTAESTAQGVYRDLPVVDGKVYLVTALTRITGEGSYSVRFSSPSWQAATTTPPLTNGEFQEVHFLYVGRTTHPRLVVRTDSIGVPVEVKSLSVKEILGHHASQTTTTARPILGRVPKGGRRNRLPASPVWGINNAASKVDNEPVPYPSGAGTRVIATSAGGGTGVYTGNTLGGFAQIGQIITASIRIKPISSTLDMYIALEGAAFSGVNIARCLFDWPAATATKGGTAIEATATEDPNYPGYYILTVTGVAANTGDVTVVVYSRVGGNFEWIQYGLQVEVSSTASAYQHVASPYDITEEGVEDCWYLAFDGVDDCLSTGNIDFTGTDRMTAVIGLVTDTAPDTTTKTSVVFETSTNLNNHNGGFSLSSPRYSGTSTNVIYHSFTSKGTALARTNILWTSKERVVLSATSDISKSRLLGRKNRAEAVDDVPDTQGTGTYEKYPLFIGARAGTTLYLRGECYGLILRGEKANLRELETAEDWINNRIGVY